MAGNPNSRYVVTLAEDQILRIWDKTMPEFSADVSMFTGKVKVNSEAAAEKAKQNFKAMFKDISG